MIRAATPADAAAVADVKCAAARRAYAPFATPEELNDWFTHRADQAVITERITDPDSTYLVATDHGHVIGTGLVRPLDAIGRQVGYLSDLYVDPPGTGTGTAIVEALLAYADTRWAALTCFTLDGNPDAQRFLARFGFHEVCRRPNRELPGTLVEMVRIPQARPARLRAA